MSPAAAFTFTLGLAAIITVSMWLDHKSDGAAFWPILVGGLVASVALGQIVHLLL